MSPDWSEMFTFSISPLEIIIRGSIVYWFIFVLLRVAGAAISARSAWPTCWCWC